MVGKLFRRIIIRVLKFYWDFFVFYLPLNIMCDSQVQDMRPINSPIPGRCY